MFPKNAWYVACLPSDLDGVPLGRTVCGQRMVFFRGPDGRPAAVDDWCPHRGAPLSLGRVVDGRLVCGYHGLEMGCDGRTVAMPGQRVRGFPANTAFPVIERYGYVWVWPGDPARADPAALPDLAWAEDPAWAFGGGMFHVRCDYRLMIDNLMDLTHETFVHGSSIGNEAVAETPFAATHSERTATVTRWMEDIEPPPFWRAQLGKPGNVDRWQIIRFEAPATVVIDVGVAPAGTGAPKGDRSQGVNGMVLNTITPETASTCHYFWAFARNYKRGDQALTTQICDGVASIFREDEAILEAQQRAIDENPGRDFYNINIDAGSMWARRKIDKMLADEAERGAVPQAAQ